MLNSFKFKNNNPKTLLFALFFFISNSLSAQSKTDLTYDICVYGGTSAGVIAAYTARKAGKSVILVEPGKHLGGLSSGGLGYTDIGNKYAITGLARDFYRRVGKHYGKFEQWTFEPKVAESIFKDYADRAGLKVLYETRITDLKKEGNAIGEIICESASGSRSVANTIIKAKVFIDCTYEGDLMARAGVSYIIGREDNKDYSETINGVQLMDGHQFPAGVDPYKIPGQAESGLLWGVSNEQLQPNGAGDKKVQAYNYRICLSSDPANRVEITKPENYDSSHYELLLRLMAASPQKKSMYDYFIWSKMPNNKTDINNRGGFSTDMIGMNYSYPDADYKEREKIIKSHESYTKGLLYFFGHDTRVPVEMRKEMLKWGYPKDEYLDNNHWSHQLYVREARRMIGSYVMNQANCEGGEIVTDGVGMAAYTMDSHNTQRIIVNGQVKNEGNVEVGGFGPYPISYKSLTPKESECNNLLVPVCLSATHIAYGSIRMEPVFMVLGQSSAIAAAMAIDAKTDVQKIDISKLQAKLKADPLVDGSILEILVDNDDKEQVVINGNWSVRNRGGYGPSFLTIQNDSINRSVKFIPPVQKAGDYTAYAYFPKLADASSKTKVSVFDGKKLKEIIINKADIVVEGQTSGEWVSLGNYTLSKGNRAYVEISSQNADGLVIADAVVFVPTKQDK